MTLHLNQQLTPLIEELNLQEQQQFIVHPLEKVRDLNSSCEILEKYADTKWSIINLLNQKYKQNFDLCHWLDDDLDDEVSFFLNEAGSNCLNYSQFKAPYQYHLWLGKDNFILGIEQKGQGFNAEEVNKNRIKSNAGKAFEFFRNCKSKIFFDNPLNAKIVYFQWSKR